MAQRHFLIRFFQKVNFNTNKFWDGTECWEWKGSNDYYYGHFSFNGRQIKTHRFSYQYFVDEDLKPYLEVGHLCNNTLCLRPSHLKAMTPKENVHYSNTTAHLNSLKTHCKHGHEFTPENTYIRKDRNGNRECITCHRIATGYCGGMLNSEKTHCINGHEFTEENTYIYSKSNYRACKACSKNRYLQKKRKMQILILGDTHGKYDLEHLIIQKVINKNSNIKAIFHCGDWGYAWPTKYGPAIWEYPFKIPFHVTLGNHDPYSFYQTAKLPDWLHIQERGSTLNIHGKKILWCGGAFSIDRAYRILNQSYWLEETIKQSDLDKCLAQEGPIDLLVTHETAEYYPLKAKRPEFTEGRSDRIAVQTIIDKFKPKYHTFGHWHSPDNGDYIHQDGSITKWACIPEVDSGHFAVWDGENLELSWLDTTGRP